VGGAVGWGREWEQGGEVKKWNAGHGGVSTCIAREEMRQSVNVKETNHIEDRPNGQDDLTYPMPMTVLMRRRRTRYSSKQEEQARWRSRQQLGGRPPPSVLMGAMCAVLCL
jgi:hypothetical protein